MSDTPFSRSGRALALSLVVAAAAVSGACQRTPSPGAATDATDTAPIAVRAPFDAMLSVVNNSGAIRFDGTIGDDATKARIEQSLLSAYGPGRATGDIVVDKAARPPKWIESLAGFLKILEPSVGAAVRFEGDSIVLSGQVDLDRRRALRTAAESAFPGARLQGLFELPAETPAAGTIAPEALAKNLNQMPVKFDNGGGNVSVDSLDLVAQAADSIRAAPPGTKLLIVGPVVATADAGNDMFLSKQRAEALKVQLILNGVSPASIETRGWGQKPDGTQIEGAAPPPEGAAMRFELVR
jgi:outer membrane protein OmpA-like peptidoglycan-associated protein